MPDTKSFVPLASFLRAPAIDSPVADAPTAISEPPVDEPKALPEQHVALSEARRFRAALADAHR